MVFLSVLKLIARNKELEKELRSKEKELADEKEKVEILKKIPAHLYASRRMKCEAVFANRALYSVAKMCRAFGIKQCVYYQWLRLKARRERRKAGEKELVDKVRKAFDENRKLYGCRKLRVALINEDLVLSEWKVRRIMRENGLYPVTLRKFKPYKKGKSYGFYSENVIKRNFSTEELN